MRRDELEPLIRAAGAILRVDHVYIIGSQAILGTFDETRLPAEATLSQEADIIPPHDADERLADLIDGTLGEGSPFHDAFGVYADGVALGTARLPQGWQARLVAVSNENTQGVVGYCLDPEDLLVSKYLAHRVKDLSFCRAVIRAGLVDGHTVAARISTAPGTPDEHRLALAALYRDLGETPPGIPGPGPVS
ncbi:MAG: hypothetical protein M0Z54_14775 [Thermaerobacter sp.]|nr:hypothetical protein [Thermaerobacter sp.]